jgi:PRTRC genetic system protein E
MQTNFFNHITGLPFQGNLNLTIAKGADGKLTVSLLLANETADKAGHIIPPMILRGDATELDEGFFGAISTPLQKTAQLFANMDAYQKSLDEAQQKSKAELDKKNKANKVKSKTATSGEADEDDENDKGPETENLFTKLQNDQNKIAEKKKRYDDAMSQITELNKQCKYAEAIALLPTVEDYPDKEAELTRKGEELAKRKKQYEELMQEI